MKKLILVCSIFAGILVVLGIIAPTEFAVERNVVIDKPKEEVFNHLKFLKNHSAWSPWEKRDPNMKKDYKGVDGTTGFILSWSGNSEVGIGEQEIKKITEGERIETELRFKKPMEDTSQAYLLTEAIDPQKTKVVWGIKGKMPFPQNVICLLMSMEKVLKNDLDSGLNSLKTNLEK